MALNKKKKIAPAPEAIARGAYSQQESKRFQEMGGVVGGNAEATRIAQDKARLAEEQHQQIIKRNDPTRDFVRQNPNGTVTYRPAGQPEQTLTQENYRKLDESIQQQKRIDQEILAGYEAKKHEKEVIAAAEKKSQTPEQQAAIAGAGTLTPEQQAMVNAPIQPFEENKVGQITQSAVQGAAMGATGAATAGLALAPFTGGASIPALAALGGAAGFITGVVTGTFAAFKHEAVTQVSEVDDNVAKAQYNIRQAIITANKGGDIDVVSKQFGDAYAELLRADREYKSLGMSDYAWATNTRLKQNELANYMAYTFPGQQERYRLAILKPDPAYVDMGLDEGGNPI